MSDQNKGTSSASDTVHGTGFDTTDEQFKPMILANVVRLGTSFPLHVSHVPERPTLLRLLARMLGCGRGGSDVRGHVERVLGNQSQKVASSTSSAPLKSLGDLKQPRVSQLRTVFDTVCSEHGTDGLDYTMAGKRMRLDKDSKMVSLRRELDSMAIRLNEFAGLPTEVAPVIELLRRFRIVLDTQPRYVATTIATDLSCPVLDKMSGGCMKSHKDNQRYGHIGEYLFKEAQKINVGELHQICQGAL
jgi:hypothetical protein